MPSSYSSRREYMREYQRNWIARRREEYFKDKSCIQCGSTEDLELDHIDPTTKVHHSIWSWSQHRREEELAKCQVLCHTHHMKKSIEQRPITNGYQAYRHGTPGMYSAKCRCGLCRLWRKNYYHEVEKPRTMVVEAAG